MIRAYETRDRDAVRRICCDTADRGEALENFFSDRALIADLVTRYFTDFEPEHSWVVEDAGRMVGYLNGCIDSHRCRQITVWRILPAAVWAAVLRGALCRRESWRLLRGMARFEQQARAVAVLGVHASVRGDNAGGCRFFERMGFRAVKRVPLVLPAEEDWLITESVIYAKKL